MSAAASLRPRVLLTRRWTDEVEAYLASRYELTRNESDRPMTADELRAGMLSHDALCPTVTDRIDAALLETRDARVKIVGNFGVGFNHIDVNAARAAKIVVTNTPDVLTDTTANIAITLMLMATRRAGEGERELRGGKWIGWRPTHMMGVEISGRIFGIVGFGRIAQATARRARAFGMRIMYYSRRRAPADIEAECGAEYCESLDALVERCDVLSLHTPGGADTLHLINGERLSRMKPTAVVINTARGTVIDEAALALALSNGTIAAAGLDVYEHEPKVHPELLKLENVVLLPHLGSATVDTRTAMGMRVATNLDAYFGGAAPPDRVA